MKTSLKTAFFTLFTLLLFIAGSSIQAQTGSNRVYIKIEVDGMACPYCAYGMEKELKKVSGVDNVDIELKEGLAFISTPANQKPTRESLEKIIIDAGFTVGKIAFSPSPFTDKTRK